MGDAGLNSPISPIVIGDCFLLISPEEKKIDKDVIAKKFLHLENDGSRLVREFQEKIFWGKGISHPFLNWLKPDGYCEKTALAE